LKKDIALIQGVQRRATNLVHHLRDFQYEDRLRALHSTILEIRRLRGDLIEVFKILKGLDKLECERFFKVNTSGTRGHQLKLFKPRCRLNYKKFAFSLRVFDIWNALSFDILAFNSVNSFKQRVDSFLEGRRFI
jgi:ribonucleases P/MRP protein subunit RPP40